MTAIPARPSIRERAEALQRAQADFRRNRYQIVEDPFSLYRDLAQLGLTTAELRNAVLEALKEITPRDYRGDYPPERAYEPAVKDAELFPFCWQSTSRKTLMYIKFCFHEDQTCLVSFHRSRKVVGQ